MASSEFYSSLVQTNIHPQLPQIDLFSLTRDILQSLKQQIALDSFRVPKSDSPLLPIPSNPRQLTVLKHPLHRNHLHLPIITSRVSCFIEAPFGNPSQTSIQTYLQSQLIALQFIGMLDSHLPTVSSSDPPFPSISRTVDVFLSIARIRKHYPPDEWSTFPSATPVDQILPRSSEESTHPPKINTARSSPVAQLPSPISEGSPVLNDSQSLITPAPSLSPSSLSLFLSPALFEHSDIPKFSLSTVLSFQSEELIKIATHTLVRTIQLLLQADANKHQPDTPDSPFLSESEGHSQDGKEILISVKSQEETERQIRIEEHTEREQDGNTRVHLQPEPSKSSHSTDSFVLSSSSRPLSNFFLQLGYTFIHSCRLDLAMSALNSAFRCDPSLPFAPTAMASIAILGVISILSHDTLNTLHTLLAVLPRFPDSTLFTPPTFSYSVYPQIDMVRSITPKQVIIEIGVFLGQAMKNLTIALSIDPAFLPALCLCVVLCLLLEQPQRARVFAERINFIVSTATMNSLELEANQRRQAQDRMKSPLPNTAFPQKMFSIPQEIIDQFAGTHQLDASLLRIFNFGVPPSLIVEEYRLPPVPPLILSQQSLFTLPTLPILLDRTSDFERQLPICEWIKKNQDWNLVEWNLKAIEARRLSMIDEWAEFLQRQPPIEVKKRQYSWKPVGKSSKVDMQLMPKGLTEEEMGVWLYEEKKRIKRERQREKREQENHRKEILNQRRVRRQAELKNERKHQKMMNTSQTPTSS
ncbi:hypothetical protein BLNAU_22925 [Blattamonas nauphoetae]|uniref:Uncharacterized protein n=1 Tax=Blattamonas nauphoetae TaxID=2049346 RepID=A0ABQ9WS63_9EUKA|nr:hypothetical protein BLNAU_22925 [Blattamonas nauphoetae]